jgi:hypothetical protein
MTMRCQWLYGTSHSDANLAIFSPKTLLLLYAVYSRTKSTVNH